MSQFPKMWLSSCLILLSTDSKFVTWPLSSWHPYHIYGNAPILFRENLPPWTCIPLQEVLSEIGVGAAYGAPASVSVVQGKKPWRAMLLVSSFSLQDWRLWMDHVFITISGWRNGEGCLANCYFCGSACRPSTIQIAVLQHHLSQSRWYNAFRTCLFWSNPDCMTSHPICDILSS